MYITLKELDEIFPWAVRSRFPIMLRGKHGVSKSELIKSFAHKIGSILYPTPEDRKKAYGDEKYIYPVLERRSSQMADAGDLMGLPKITGNTTSFIPMEWFYEACQKPCILFLDELDRGANDIRMAFMQLADSRELSGHKLHKDSLIFSCVNGGNSNSGTYQVGELDPAELSRWTVFDVKPTEDEWLAWAKDKIDPQIWDFIKDNKNLLDHNAEYESGKVYPCRRSWTRFNHCIQESGLLGDNKDVVKLKNIYYLANAFVGEECAATFRDYCQNYERKLTLDDIFKGNFNGLSSLDIGVQMTLVDRLSTHNLLKDNLFTVEKIDGKEEEIKHPNDVLKNIVRFYFLLNPELAMRCWEQVLQANPENGILMHAMNVDGKEVSGYLQQLIEGNPDIVMSNDTKKE